MPNGHAQLKSILETIFTVEQVDTKHFSIDERTVNFTPALPLLRVSRPFVTGDELG
jgi:hypothetical protein